MKLRHTLLLLCACTLNLLPMFTQHIGGDIAVHLTRLHCFAEQFWQGDLLPRWCFAADGGVGSPALLFYPPLPYLVTSLFYPLHWMGFTLYGVYVAAVIPATLLAAFACFRWLAPVAGANAALAGAAVYVFLPYHSEVLVNRSGYGELWVLAFAPLMADALRKMLAGQERQAPRLAVWTALAILSEPAVALCVLIGLGIHVLSQGRQAWKLWRGLLRAGIMAILLSAPYWLPAMHYMPFVAIAAWHAHETPWTNDFVLIAKNLAGGQGRLLVGLALTAVGFGWLCRALWLRGKNTIQLPIRKEAQMWIIAGAVALLMLFPISRPVWQLINAIAPIGFPWRMQAPVTLAISFLAAVYMAGRKRKTAAGDCAALVLFLFCFELFVTFTVAPQDMPFYHRLVASEAMSLPESRTQWSAVEYSDPKGLAALKRYESANQSPVETVEGAAIIRVRQWSWKGIEIEADALKGPATLRVYQRYFPLWQMRVADNSPVTMQPEFETGYMLLTVPEGRHAISIRLEPWWSSLLGIGARREKNLEIPLVGPRGFVTLP